MTTRSEGTGRGPVAFLRRVHGPEVRSTRAGRSSSGLREAARVTSRFLAPQWLLIHVFAWAAAVTMILLGRWQLRVSDAKHFDLQNFSYVIQWWAFAAFALLFWARLLRDAVRPPPPRVSAGGEVALRTGAGTGLTSAYTGPAEMVVAGSGVAGAEPVVYRGYVIPESAHSLHRSKGDDYHESYNDYLWELSLADAAEARKAPSVAPLDDPRPEQLEDAKPGRVIEGAAIDIEGSPLPSSNES